MLGRFHFGGISYNQASVEFQDEQDHLRANKEVHSKLAECGDIEMHDPDWVMNDPKKFNVSFTSQKVGGLQNSQFEEWLNQLANQNQNWQAIEYGTDLVPVWDLIRKNHSKDLQDDLHSITKLLQSEYLKLMNVHYVKNYQTQEAIVSLINEINLKYNDFFERQKLPIYSSNEILERILDHLGSLLSFKLKFLSKADSLNDWTDYLSTSKQSIQMLEVILESFQEDLRENVELRKQIQETTIEFYRNNEDENFLIGHQEILEKFQRFKTFKFEDQKDKFANPLHGGFDSILENLIKQQKENEAKNKYNPSLIKNFDTLIKDMLYNLQTQENQQPCNFPQNSFQLIFKLYVLNYLEFNPERESMLFSIHSSTIIEFKERLQEAFILLLENIQKCKVFASKKQPDYDSTERINTLSLALQYDLALKISSLEDHSKSHLYDLIQDEWKDKSPPFQISKENLQKRSTIETLRFILSQENEEFDNLQERLSMDEAEFQQFIQERASKDQLINQAEKVGQNMSLDKVRENQISHEQARQQFLTQALEFLDLNEVIGGNRAKKVYNVPFAEEGSTINMVELEKDRAIFIWHQILMKNPDALLMMSQESIDAAKNDFNFTKIDAQDEQKGTNDDSSGNDLYGKECSDGTESQDDKPQFVKPPHCLDILCHLFQASDHSVKEILTKNMHCCQLATPLIMPSREMILYPYQNTQKTWNSWDLNGNIVYHKSQNIFRNEGPVISFIRVGNCDYSKSQLINSLLFNGRNVFMHKDISSDMANKTIDGLVELAWFVPSYNQLEEGKISDLTTILNLRGDAESLPDHVRMLKKFSDLVIIVADSYKKFQGTLFKLKDESERNFLWIAKENDAAKKKEGFVKILKERFVELSSQTNEPSMKSIREHIASRINPIQGKKIKGFSIHKMGIQYASGDNGYLDLHSPILEKAKILANEFALKANHSQKQQIVPLQDEQVWGTYTENVKKLRRVSAQTGDVVESIKKMKKTCEKCRQKQRNLSKEPHPAMNHFIQTIKNEDSETSFYFIEFLTQYLNERSQVDMKKINEDYRVAFQNLEEVKGKKKPSQERLIQCQLEVEMKGKEKIQKSFGVEHLFRECGQIYESLQESNEEIPLKVAALVKRGITIEFMDGENSYVPTEWIAAIINHLGDLCENEQVHIQSIVGVQSSGKSTFLNCQYNSKFAVAAERCTKGIYMQLLEIDEKLMQKLDLKSRYILNLDTEGLRAPELAGNHAKSIKHDNEMGTFIVAIADSTTINISGLANVTSVSEILDIIVHAVLKIRDSVGLEPKIKFVHQQVDDANPEESNKEAKLKILEQLDNNTRKTAKLLGFDESVIRSFSDVIPLDSQSAYVNSLFDGNFINSAYSTLYMKKVQELKIQALEQAAINQKLNSQKKQTFSQVATKLKMLWESVLAENFAFAFQNANAILAYKELEKIQKNHFDKIVKEIEEIDQDINIRLDCATGYKVLTEEKITQEMKCLESTLREEHKQQISEEIQKIIDDTDNTSIKFFEDETIKTIEYKIIEMIRSHQASLISKSQSKKIRGTISESINKYKENMHNKCIEFYHINKDHFNFKEKDDSELEYIFENQFWKQALDQVIQQGQLYRHEIKKFPDYDLQNILDEYFQKGGKAQREFNFLLTSGFLWSVKYMNNQNFILHGKFLTKDNFDNFVRDNMIKKGPICGQKIPKENTVEKGIQVVGRAIKKKVYKGVDYFIGQKDKMLKIHEQIQRDIDEQFQKSKRDLPNIYNATLMRKILNEIITILEDNNQYKEIKYRFEFKDSYILRCMARYGQMFIPLFIEKVKHEEDESDPVKILNTDLYPTLLAQFQVIAKELGVNQEQAQICGKIFNQHIEKQLQSNICLDHFFSTELAHNIKGLNSKKELIKTAMDEILSEEKDFSECDRFIRHFENYATNLFMRQIVKQITIDKIQKFNQDYSTEITNSIFNIAKSNLSKSNNINQWLEYMIKDIHSLGNNQNYKKIAIETKNFTDSVLVKLEHKFDDNDLKEVFFETFSQQIDAKALEHKIQVATQESLNYYLTKIIKNGKLGCLRTCQFCGAVCDNPVSGHRGIPCSSNLHRFMGMNGCKKTQNQDQPNQIDRLINHYNCNTASNENQKWRWYFSDDEQDDEFKLVPKFNEHKNPKGKKYVFEDFRTLNQHYKWDIKGDVLKKDGSQFWQWYMKRYKDQILGCHQCDGFTEDMNNWDSLSTLKQKAKQFTEKYDDM